MQSSRLILEDEEIPLETLNKDIEKNIKNQNDLEKEIDAIFDKIEADSNNNDCIKNDSCSTFLRLMTSIYAGEMIWFSSSITASRLLHTHHWSPDAELALIFSCAIPGALSGLLFWWSTGQIEKWINTRSYWEQLDKLEQQSSHHITFKNNQRWWSIFDFSNNMSTETTSLVKDTVNTYRYGTR